MPIEDEKTSFPQVTVQHVNVCFATKLPVEFPSTLPAQEAQLQNGTVVGTVPPGGPPNVGHAGWMRLHGTAGGASGTLRRYGGVAWWRTGRFPRWAHLRWFPRCSCWLMFTPQNLWGKGWNNHPASRSGGKSWIFSANEPVRTNLPPSCWWDLFATRVSL